MKDTIPNHLKGWYTIKVGNLTLHSDATEIYFMYLNSVQRHNIEMSLVYGKYAKTIFPSEEGYKEFCDKIIVKDKDD